MGYLLEYDETNPISIETYGKRLIGKTFQDICDEDDMRKAAVVRETENYEVRGMMKSVEKYRSWNKKSVGTKRK